MSFLREQDQPRHRQLSSFKAEPGKVFVTAQVPDEHAFRGSLQALVGIWAISASAQLCLCMRPPKNLLI